MIKHLLLFHFSHLPFDCEHCALQLRKKKFHNITFNHLCAIEVTDKLGHVSVIKLLDVLALLELLNAKPWVQCNVSLCEILGGQSDSLIHPRGLTFHQCSIILSSGVGTEGRST